MIDRKKDKKPEEKLDAKHARFCASHYYHARIRLKLVIEKKPWGKSLVYQPVYLEAAVLLEIMNIIKPYRIH